MEMISLRKNSIESMFSKIYVETNLIYNDTNAPYTETSLMYENPNATQYRNKFDWINQMHNWIQIITLLIRHDSLYTC